MASAAPLDRRDIMTAMAAIMLSILTAALDQTVVTPALTTISRDLHALDQLSWVVVAYLLTMTAFTPICGKLGDLYGRGRVMLVAITVFTLASVLCAGAQTLVQLVVARALQGTGGGALIVLAQGMVADFVSPRERGRYQAYVASMWAFAGIAGPPIGGLLAEHASWRWIFWVNVPLGVATFAFARRAAAKLKVPSRPVRRLDIAGSLLLIATVAFLLAWTSLPGVAAWVPFLGLAFGIAFVVRERYATEPILPPRLYRNPVIRLTSIVATLISAVQFSALVLLPVYVQIVGGFGVAAGGLMIIPMLTGIPIAATTSGLIMARTGRYKAILPFSCAFMAAAFGYLAVFGNPSALPQLIVAIGVLGLGVGSSGPVLMTATQNSAEARDVGAATASIGLARSLGAAFGTALFWAILLASGGGSIVAASHGGFHEVFAVAAGIMLVTGVLALFLKEEPLKTAPRTNLGGSRVQDRGERGHEPPAFAGRANGDAHPATRLQDGVTAERSDENPGVAR